MRRKVLHVFTILGVLALPLLGIVSYAVANSTDSSGYMPLVLRNYPRTLTICTGSEPDSLYIFSQNTQAKRQVWEAIYDGPIDNRSFSYQGIILTKIPSLSSDDAVINSITVSKGDTVVDANNEVVSLEPGVMVILSGGTEPVEYTGGSIQMDQMVVTFKMMSGLTWSDGKPLTASDSVYAFNLLKDPGTPGGKSGIERTKSYKALDDVTVQWTGLPGFKNVSYNHVFVRPAPKHAWKNYTAAELLTAEVSTRKPIGWGAYTIEKWVSGDYILLKRNPYYFRASEGLPKFEYLKFRFVGTDAQSSIEDLLNGKCDILDTTTKVENQVDLLLQLESEGKLNAIFGSGTIWEHVDFGIQNVSYDDGYQSTDRPNFFGDVRTRRAFAMCMDRQAVVDQVLYGQSSVLDTYVPPEHPFYNPNIKKYKFDVAAASDLLKQVGWLDTDNSPSTPRIASGIPDVPDGTPLKIKLESSNSSTRTEVLNILAGSLSKCGIGVTINQYHPSEWFKSGPDGRLYGRKFDLGEFSWLTGPYPPCNLYRTEWVPGPAGGSWTYIVDGSTHTFSESGWDATNTTGWSNSNFDIACHDALNLLPGQSGFKAAHQDAQASFANQVPAVPLFLNLRVAATRPGVHGFSIDTTADSELWNIEKFSIDQ